MWKNCKPLYNIWVINTFGKIVCWHLICSPIHPRFLRQVVFKPCIRPGYFLLQSSDCMMETCMLLAGRGSMSIGDPSKASGSGALKTSWTYSALNRLDLSTSAARLWSDFRESWRSDWQHFIKRVSHLLSPNQSILKPLKTTTEEYFRMNCSTVKSD